MLIRVVFVTLIVLIYVRESNTQAKKSDGTLWPKPVEEKKKLHFYVYTGNIFNAPMNSITSDACPLLTRAEQRFVERLNKLYSYAHPQADVPSEYNYGKLQLLTIRWAKPCEAVPYYEMDESYNLTVRPEIILESNSVWGIMRGLETLLQLFYFKDKALIINHNNIVDYPYFLHRGLMIDTARHYVPVNTILTILEAMSLNKMNVFHWHLTDDESFPFVSKSYPGLSINGSFYKTKVYNSTAIKEVVDYAAARGIRVIPEVSMPDRNAAIAYTYPSLFVKCFNEAREPTGWGPINPLKNVTYGFLKNLYKDIITAFPESFVHIGYADVAEECWLADLETRDFLRNLPIHLREDALHVIFLEEVTKILNNLNKVKSEIYPAKYIIWQNSLVNHRVPMDDLVMQMTEDWITDDNPHNTKTNFSFIYSVPWNLTGNYMNKFEAMYLGGNKLRDFQEAIGGEAYIETHYVDDMNIVSSVWPLTSSVAEVLWNPDAIDDIVIYNCSDAEYLNPDNPFVPDPESLCVPSIDFQSVYERLEVQICRMLRMGIPTGPGRRTCDLTNYTLWFMNNGTTT